MQKRLPFLPTHWLGELKPGALFLVNFQIRPFIIAAFPFFLRSSTLSHSLRFSSLKI